MRRLACLLFVSICGRWPPIFPVREVVLYKHGVGYFERSGRLGAGESARLDFKADDMNDVLKSLTIEENGGGKISGLRYDSSDPLAKKLADFPFSIGSDQPLAPCLDQFKGARVELKFGAETVAGAIVSARRMVGGANLAREREQATLMLDSGEIRTVDLGAVSSIRFTDPKLQIAVQGLSRGARAIALEGQAQRLHRFDRLRRARDRRQLHDSSPVWKSSYRLIFGDKRTTDARRLGHCR